MGDYQEMIDLLWLTDQIHWDLALYWIFLINAVLLIMQPEGSAFATLILIVVLMAAVLDKVFAFGYLMEVDLARYTRQECHEKVFIGTYLLRVAMFAGPLSIAGSTKDGKVRAVAIVSGVSGGAYSFTRWYFQQQDADYEDLMCSFLFGQFALQYAGVALVMARLVLRDKLRLGAVHRHIPVVIAREPAAHDVEV